MNHQLAHRRISTASEPHSSRAPTNCGDGSDEIEANDNDGRDYKLIIDPALGQGKDKVIRYNGCMPGRDLVPIGVVDPRPRISRYSLSRHSVNLKIPDFQVDVNYVGKILPKEVTLTNLNNNINVAFLQDMCKAFGDIKSSVIFYHPKTKKHLGIAQVIFSSARAAQRCIEKLNETSKMGNIITIFADPSGERRKKLLDELVTNKIIFRPPSPKLQLPVNIMDELKNLAPPPASSLSSSSSASVRSNGIGQPTSKTASPSTNTTTPRSTNLRSNVYSDPDLLRRSHSNGASFPSSQRGDSVFPGRAELPTIRRQSIDPSSSSSVIHHHHQQQQQSNPNAWNQTPVHDQSSQPETKPPFVANHNAAAAASFSSGHHESNSYVDNSATERPNWRGRGGHRNETTLGYLSQSTNSLDGEKLCEGRFNDTFPPPERCATGDLGFENSNESFHLSRQSNANVGFQKQISRDAFKHTKHSPTNFTSQNSQESFGPMPESSSSHDLLSFNVQQGSREVITRAVDSQQTTASQLLSQVGFWPATNSPTAAFAQQNSLTNFKQNSLSEENPSESPAALQKSLNAIKTVDPRKLKGSHAREKETKDVRQQREDETDRIESRDKMDFVRKSSSHDAEMSSRDSKHGSRHHDGSRHRNRNHDSSHGRRRSRHKKHRSHHRRHRSSSRESSSSNNARQQQQMSLSRDSSGQRRLNTAPNLPPPPLPPLPPLPCHSVAPPLPFPFPFPPLPSDCFLPPSNDVISSSIADSSLPQQSLESRIQQLLGQTEERINGFSTLVFPPPLPPELPPPPLPPPADAELPPLPPEPAPLDEVVDASMMVEGGMQHISGQSNNYGEKTNYIYNALVNCKAGEMKAGSMSRHAGSLPGSIHFNGELIDRSGQHHHHHHQQMTSSVTSSEIPLLLSDSFQSELQYPMAVSSYWYPPYPHDAHVSNSLPLDNGLYGSLSINNGLYGNLPFDKALYSIGAYGGAFTLPPGGLSRDEVVDDGNFAVILDELVAELKKVMVKDMQKKMVENIGFKVYENWWKNEEGKEKMIVQKPLHIEGVKSRLELKPRSSLDQTTTTTPHRVGVVPAPSSASFTSDPLLSLRVASASAASTAASTASTAAPTKANDSSSSLLWSLFDNNKDGSEAGGGGGGGRVGFGGGGGLLGLRGAVAKMPSFRKKMPSPLPERERDEDDDDDDDDEEEDEEEEDEDEEEGPVTFRGPRTPEESENEEEDDDDDDGDDDVSSSSLGDDEDLANSVKLLQRTRPSRAFVYSSSSSSGEEEEEVRPEEDEDEEVSQAEEEEDLTAAEESDMDVDQSGLPEMERDEGPKQKRRLLLSSEDEDEVVVVATKPDKDETCRDAKPRRFPNDAAARDSPSSLPLLSPAAAVSSSLASRFTHLLDDKRTPVVVLTASPTISSPTPSAPLIAPCAPLMAPCAPLMPDPVPSESVIQDHSEELEELEADEIRIDSMRHEDDSVRREDSTKNDDRLMRDDVKVEKNKELVLLPTIKALHLVNAWLSAMRLDHAYSLSSALLHKPKKGRKPRNNSVQFRNGKNTDDDYDANLSDETLSLTDSAIGLTATLPSLIALDHNYCHPFLPVDEPTPVVSDSDEGGETHLGLLPVRIMTDSGEVLNTEDVPNILMEVDVVEEVDEEKLVEDEIPVTRKRKRLSDVTNFPGSRELANILPPVVRKLEYNARGEKEETDVMHEYLSKGLDAEDLAFLKRQYDELVQEDCPRTYWVNETHWVNHPPTLFELTPPRKRSRMMSRMHHDAIEHATGSARTEGYYKISRQAKSLYLRHTRRVDSDDDDNLDDDVRRCVTDEVARKKSQQSRDVRSESRRWQNLFTTDLGDEMGDILKFNKLEIRKKQLKFARSRIHDWGLFAMEPIVEGEMVIEYVGEVVRRSVADALEKRYEALGIGSSYLFRVDHNVIIDATKHGNLSRFINHSCSPNCYAKIITVDSAKKIVIYSKRDIQINDEITYDYKFPLEDEKIPCLCGASGCRGTLN